MEAFIFSQKKLFKYIDQFDIIGFQETWLDKKGWEVIEEKLPKECTWMAQHARRDDIKEKKWEE